MNTTVRIEITDDTYIKLGILAVMIMLFSLLIHYVKK
jgi:hypothetical protein